MSGTHDNCTKCWYCGDHLTRHEHDHAPFPRRLGGTVTVPACLRCHDLKDRVPLMDWPADLAYRALDALGSGEGFWAAKVLAAKMFHVLTETEAAA